MTEQGEKASLATVQQNLLTRTSKVITPSFNPFRRVCQIWSYCWVMLTIVEWKCVKVRYEVAVSFNLWPPNSNQVILESMWMLGPNFEEIPSLFLRYCVHENSTQDISSQNKAPQSLSKSAVQSLHIKYARFEFHKMFHPEIPLKTNLEGSLPEGNCTRGQKSNFRSCDWLWRLKATRWSDEVELWEGSLTRLHYQWLQYLAVGGAYWDAHIWCNKHC